METKNVVLCGCGPDRSILAYSLGRNAAMGYSGARTGNDTDPRVITLDEYGIGRLLTCGIYSMISVYVRQYEST